MIIETWPLSRLVPYERNPRKNDHAVEKLARAIKEFGFRVPILALSETGQIVDGHLRWKAAKAAGLAEVPVVLADDMTPEQVRAFRIAVNRMAELADWDDELLKEELLALGDLGMDLELLGFDSADVDKLLGEPSNPWDRVPEAEKGPPTSAPGDLWVLGDHRLFVGDSTTPEAFDIVMGDNVADMVLTDPPYGIDYNGAARKERKRIENDDLSGSSLEEFLKTVFNEMLNKTKPGGAVYVCCPSGDVFRHFLNCFCAAPIHFSSNLVWKKHHFSLTRVDYKYNHEFIMYGWKKGAKHCFFGGYSKRSVQELSPDGFVKKLNDGRFCFGVGEYAYIVSGENVMVEAVCLSTIEEAKPAASDLQGASEVYGGVLPAK